MIGEVKLFILDFKKGLIFLVSRNNFKNKMEAEARRVPHYSLRKLSIGVASVLLSTTLYFGMTAHADTNVPVSDNNQPEANKVSDQKSLASVSSVTLQNQAANQNTQSASTLAGSAASDPTSQASSAESSSQPVQSSSASSENASSENGVKSTEADNPADNQVVGDASANVSETSSQDPVKTTDLLNNPFIANNVNMLAQSFMVVSPSPQSAAPAVGSEVKYQSGTAGVNDQFNRYVTRTINVTKPDGTNTSQQQTVHFVRGGEGANAGTVQQDGTIKFEAWTVADATNKSTGINLGNFAAYKLDQVAGYTPVDQNGSTVVDSKNSQVVGQVVLPYMVNQSVNVIYNKTGVTKPILFVDDDDNSQVVKDASVTGNTGDKVNVDNAVPDGYVLAQGKSGVGTSVTLDAGDLSPITVHVKELVVDVPASSPVTAGTNVPGTTGKTFVSGLGENDLNRTVTRKVTINEPGKTPVIKTDTVHFTRTAHFNVVKGTVTYDAWSENGQHTFDAITIPEVDGYQAEMNGDINTVTGAVVVTPDSQDMSATVGYQALNQTVEIHFVDGENDVASFQLDGNTGDTFSQNTQQLRDQLAEQGLDPYYSIADETAVSGTFAPNMNQINVKLNHVILTYNADNIPSMLPDDSDVPDTVTKDNLRHTLTRHVTITVPDGYKKVDPQTQTVTFNRTATIDMAKIYNGEDDAVTLNSWTPSSDSMAAVDVPTIAGYTPSGTVDKITVGPDDKPSDVTITYTANAQTGKIIYQDADNNNAEVGHTDLSGATDQTVTITPTAPAGFDIVAGQNIPASEVATATGIPTVTVKVSHHKIMVTPGQKPKPGDKISGNPAKQPGDGTPSTDVSYETLHRNMTRTINVTDPHTGLKTTPVTIHYERTATIDDVTGKVTYGAWTVADGSATGFDAFTIPNVAGYTSKIKTGTADELKAFTPNQDQITNWTDQTVDIDYTANDQSMTIDYVDKNGHQVDGGHFIVSGKTDQTVNTNAKIPTGWVLVSGQNDAPKTITFGGTPQENVRVVIEHGTRHVDHNTPDEAGTKTPTGKDVAGTQESDLNQTIIRTINITEPGKEKATTTQTARIFRDATVDQVTGDVTYGDWSTDSTSWDAVAVPSRDGYTTVLSDGQSRIPAVTVKDGQKNVTIDVTYTANPHSMNINYVDTKGHKIATFEVSGVTDQTVDTNAKMPAGWVLAEGQTDAPASITFRGAHTNDINVIIVHGSHKILHDNPAKSGETVPSGKTINGAHESDLNMTVTRTINVTTPDGKTTTTPQDVHLYRDATVDDVTGEVTYDNWSTGSWEDFKPAAIDGYTVSQADVPEAAVTNETKPVTINITYTANAQHNAIDYVLNGYIVKTTDLDGVTDQTIDLTYAVPTGYTEVAGQNLPTSYKFKAKDNNHIVVQLVKNQTLTINYVGLDGTQIGTDKSVNGTTGETVDVPTNTIPAGYQLADGQTVPTTFTLNDHDDNMLEVVLKPVVVTVTADNPVKAGDAIANAHGAVYPKGLEQTDLNKTITRTIDVANADGTTTPVKTQTVHFIRNATVNAVTGDITYSDWMADGPSYFEAYRPETKDGFTIDEALSSVVTPDSSNSAVHLAYKQVPQVKTPLLIDASGKTYDELPAGYHVVAGQDSKKGSQLIAKDYTPDTPKVEYVTRKVAITMPDGHQRTVTQRVRKGTKFGRVAVPKLRGYVANVSGDAKGLNDLGVTAANGDLHVTVSFVKAK